MYFFPNMGECKEQRKERKKRENIQVGIFGFTQTRLSKPI
jgi:hypothetical protein